MLCQFDGYGVSLSGPTLPAGFATKQASRMSRRLMTRFFLWKKTWHATQQLSIIPPNHLTSTDGLDPGRGNSFTALALKLRRSCSSTPLPPPPPPPPPPPASSPSAVVGAVKRRSTDVKSLRERRQEKKGEKSKKDRDNEIKNQDCSRVMTRPVGQVGRSTTTHGVGSGGVRRYSKITGRVRSG